MPRHSKKIYLSLGLIFWFSATVFALLPSWPHLYYRLYPNTSNELASTIASTVSKDNFPVVSPSPTVTTSPRPTATPTPTPTPRLPDVDPSLPIKNGLIIDKIGVRGEIHEGTDWEKILKLGIWRAPEFGTPEQTTYPVILAAHRWGYLDWSPSFRKLNSFYNLPQLKVGDTVKLVWNQRPYEYKITATETSTKITNYSSQLILYTCQLWNSPSRFFVYADRTN